MLIPQLCQGAKAWRKSWLRPGVRNGVRKKELGHLKILPNTPKLCVVYEQMLPSCLVVSKPQRASSKSNTPWRVWIKAFLHPTWSPGAAGRRHCLLLPGTGENIGSAGDSQKHFTRACQDWKYYKITAISFELHLRRGEKLKRESLTA